MLESRMMKGYSKKKAYRVLVSIVKVCSDIFIIMHLRVY